MTDMNTLQDLAQAALDSDRDQGHAGADQQWGRYEVLVGAILERMQTRGLISKETMEAIFAGKI